MLRSPTPDPDALLQTDPDHWTGEERRAYAAAVRRAHGTIGPASVAEAPAPTGPAAVLPAVPVTRVTDRDPLLVDDAADLAFAGDTGDIPHAHARPPAFLCVAEQSLHALLPAATDNARLRAEIAHAWYELDRMVDVLFTGSPPLPARSTSRSRDPRPRAAGRPRSRR